MKSAIESLGPTRVRLTVEVPFEELQPSVQAAYKKIAGQVKIQGFRPGKVPPPVIDRRVGREVVLEEAVNEALPVFYGRAVEENSVAIIGTPQVEVKEFSDGGQLAFTAEVDVRPEITVPDYAGMPVSVDDAEVTDEQIDEQLGALRDRFATLSAADRPAQEGDFVTLDLKVVIDGEEVDDGSATGLSYEVGSGDLLPGLDEALVGLSDGDTKTYTADLTEGVYTGKQAEITVTLRSVRVKQVPELDDDFAQTASEFDTISELRDDVRNRLARIRNLEQGGQARDRVLEALLEKVDIPLPESIVASEIEWRQHSLAHQLESAGLTKDTYLQLEGKSAEEFDGEIDTSAKQAVKAQFVLDAIADAADLQVAESDLTEQIIRRAMRLGVSPDDYLRQLVDANQIATLYAEVRRNKALGQVVDAAEITDASGRPVDMAALVEQATPPETTASDQDE
ncbi:MAG: trigger factor [Frankiales bacterium]|nr:trigger factor [Frankiales bacterium]